MNEPVFPVFARMGDTFYKIEGPASALEIYASGNCFKIERESYDDKQTAIAFDWFKTGQLEVVSEITYKKALKNAMGELYKAAFKQRSIKSRKATAGTVAFPMMKKN